MSCLFAVRRCERSRLPYLDLHRASQDTTRWTHPVSYDTTYLSFFKGLQMDCPAKRLVTRDAERRILQASTSSLEQTKLRDGHYFYGPRKHASPTLSEGELAHFTPSNANTTRFRSIWNPRVFSPNNFTTSHIIGMDS